jgi:putative phosphoesterase
MQPRTPRSELLEDGSAYCVFGAETLLKQTAELEKQIEGAKRNEDIEYIHKLRVASRRLRAGLSIFEECLPKKQVKAWRKAVKDLTTSCGAARDEDVLIAFLENYSTDLEPRAAAGIEYLVRIQKARRLLMQSDVVKVLDSLRASGILGDLSDNCRPLRRSGDDEKIDIKTLQTYGKAHEHIVARLDELLALSRFVHDQNAIAKHHELRIAAKRLRYTMEIFSAIYRGGLKDQIELMKQFQDMLGEMHDYYVWSQELSAQRETIPADARYGINRLLIHLRKRRASRYKDFVSLWDETKTRGLFTEIRELTDTRPSGEIVRELLNSERKIALISDVHGNLDALKAVVTDAEKSGLGIFLNAGDALGFGIYPSQVVQALRSPAFLSVLGNVDLEILEALRFGKPREGDSEKFPIKELSPSDVAYLQSLPRELRFEIAGTRVLLTHGSPDSVEEHIYPDSLEERLKEIAAKAEADVVVTGHTHLQMNRSVDGVTFINPGSVGRPVNGEPKAEYAVLSFNPLKVEFRRASYDIEALAEKMRKKGLPENHVQVLVRGVHLNTIEKQEKSLTRKALWKRRSTVRKVRDRAKNYFPDETHANQDRKLALMMFNKINRMHSLGPKERYWLECAAILHDIGRSRGDKGHHKVSLGLILNDPALPFTQRERYIIGSIARYHRKALPDKKHFNLTPLSRTEREKVVVLSSILRMADALDYSHRSVVNKVNLKSLADRMILECFFSDQHYLEDQSLKKRKDLFEKVFNQSLTIVWKPQQNSDHVNQPDATAVDKSLLIAENPNPMTE